MQRTNELFNSATWLAFEETTSKKNQYWMLIFHGNGLILPSLGTTYHPIRRKEIWTKKRNTKVTAFVFSKCYPAFCFRFVPFRNCFQITSVKITISHIFQFGYLMNTTTIRHFYFILFLFISFHFTSFYLIQYIYLLTLFASNWYCLYWFKHEFKCFIKNGQSPNVFVVFKDLQSPDETR